MGPQRHGAAILSLAQEDRTEVLPFVPAEAMMVRSEGSQIRLPATCYPYDLGTLVDLFQPQFPHP